MLGADNIDWATFYPVGSIYQTTKHINPSTYFKGTTWTEITTVGIGAQNISNGGMNYSGNIIADRNILQIYQPYSGAENEQFYLMKTGGQRIYLYERTA